MNKNEFKRELSKLAGIDFFNPKFKDVFDKYDSDDLNSDEEIDRAEALDVIDKDEAKEMKDTNDKVENADEIAETKDAEEDIDKAEDEREVDKIEEEKADTTELADEKAEEVKDESEEIGEKVDELKDDKTNDELLDTKIELELVRGGIKDEKLNAAKRLAKFEIHDVNELDKVQSILADYPEWVKSNDSQDFGMRVDENGDNLTEEEKRLKQMGIDPRD